MCVVVGLFYYLLVFLSCLVRGGDCVCACLCVLFLVFACFGSHLAWPIAVTQRAIYLPTGLLFCLWTMSREDKKTNNTGLLTTFLGCCFVGWIDPRETQHNQANKPQTPRGCIDTAGLDRLILLYNLPQANCTIRCVPPWMEVLVILP